MSAQTKCIFEELNANVIVVGDYKAVNRDNPSVPIYVDVRVRPVHAVLALGTGDSSQLQACMRAVCNYVTSLLLVCAGY